MNTKSPVGQLVIKLMTQANDLVNKAKLAEALGDTEGRDGYAREAFTLFTSVAEFCGSTYKKESTVTALAYRSAAHLALSWDDFESASRLAMCGLAHTHDEDIRGPLKEIAIQALQGTP